LLIGQGNADGADAKPQLDDDANAEFERKQMEPNQTRITNGIP
jgi:hypothetical protein